MTELTPNEIIRAWKDEEYRNSLSEEQRASLPPAPSDISELSEDELEVVAGGMQSGGCKCGCWGGTVTWTDSETLQ